MNTPNQEKLAEAMPICLIIVSDEINPRGLEPAIKQNDFFYCLSNRTHYTLYQLAKVHLFHYESSIDLLELSEEMIFEIEQYRLQNAHLV